MGALLILFVALVAFVGMLFAVLLAIGIPAQWLGARRAGVPAWGPRGTGSTKQIVVRANIVVAFSKAAEALATIPNVRITDVDRDRLVISLRRGPSWRSFGERAHVQFQGLAGDGVAISAASQCVPFNQVFDYGRNASNVQLFLTAIDRALVGTEGPLTL